VTSTIVKRSIAVGGHKTSVSLEEAFWTCLREIALSRGMTISGLVTLIKSRRQSGNLSSAIRLFVPESYQDLAKEKATNGLKTSIIPH
jgi:predicted DNA-binding ribbon-helix-helix protein